MGRYYQDKVAAGRGGGEGGGFKVLYEMFAVVAV